MLERYTYSHCISTIINCLMFVAIWDSLCSTLGFSGFWRVDRYSRRSAWECDIQQGLGGCGLRKSRSKTCDPLLDPAQICLELICITPKGVRQACRPVGRSCCLCPTIQNFNKMTDSGLITAFHLGIIKRRATKSCRLKRLLLVPDLLNYS
jgi:hypothetical protein